MTREEIFAAMKAGARLHMQHAKRGERFWLVATHLPVRSCIGKVLIIDPRVKRLGDALFDDELPQTFIVEG